MRFELRLRSVLMSSLLMVGHAAVAQDILPGAGRPSLQPSQPVPSAQPSSPAQPTRIIPVIVDAGSGRLIQLPGPAATILAADPRIARVQPASPTSIFIMGVTPGRTTVIAATDGGTPIAEYDVTIRTGSATADPNAARAAPSPSAVEGAIRRLCPEWERSA